FKKLVGNQWENILEKSVGNNCGKSVAKKRGIYGPYPQDFPWILPREKPVCVVVSLLGLWYPKGSDFDLKAYSDSDYAGCNLDRKSTSGDCQILRGKLICWSAKKQSSVAMSSAEAEYVATARCCAQVL
ncbi:hypothetical protein Tco_0041801, partial [Tanacetum coccineum]